MSLFPQKITLLFLVWILFVLPCSVNAGGAVQDEERVKPSERVAVGAQDPGMEEEERAFREFEETVVAENSEQGITLGTVYLEQSAWQIYRKQVMYELSLIYWRVGPFEKFYELADSFIVAYPNDAHSLRFVHAIGESRLMEDGEYALVAKQFDGYMETLPEGSAVFEGLYYWRGMAGIYLNDYETSVKGFSALLEKFPQSAFAEDATFRLGMSWFGANELEKARLQLEQFVSAFSNSNLRGEAHIFLGDIFAHGSEISQAFQHYDWAIEFTEKRKGKWAFISHALFQKAEILRLGGRLQEALEILEDYPERFEHWNKESGVRFWEYIADQHAGVFVAFEFLRESGEFALENGEREKAVSYFDAAVSIFSTHEEAGDLALRLGELLVEEGSYEEAIETYRKILGNSRWRRLGRIRAETQYQVGMIYFGKKDYATAYRYFERTFVAYALTTSLSKWAARSYLKAGQCWEHLGERKKALAVYEEFLESDVLKRHKEIYNEIKSKVDKEKGASAKNKTR